MSQFINKRGLAYECLWCRRAGKRVIAEHYRIMYHIQQRHLSEEQIEFYCSLCKFRCTDEESLQGHITMERHLAIAKQNGVTDHQRCLKINKNAYKIGERDLRAFSTEESARHWASRARKDCMAQAVEAAFPDGLMAELEEGDCLGGSGQPAMVQPEAAPVNPPQTALLGQLSQLVGGTVLQSLLKMATPGGLDTRPVTSAPSLPEDPSTVLYDPAMPEYQPSSVPATPMPYDPVRPSLQVVATPVRAPVSTASPMIPAEDSHAPSSNNLPAPVKTSRPTKMSSPFVGAHPAATPSQEEDIMGQLLPGENMSISTPAHQSMPQEPPAAKRPRTTSPEGQTEMGAFTQALTRLQEEVKASSRRMSRDLEANSRVTRCLGKDVQALTAAITQLAGAIDRETRERSRRSRSRQRRPNQQNSPKVKSSVTQVAKSRR